MCVFTYQCTYIRHSMSNISDDSVWYTNLFTCLASHLYITSLIKLNYTLNDFSLTFCL